MKFIVNVRISHAPCEVGGVVFDAHCGPITIKDPIEVSLFGWYLEEVLKEDLEKLSFLPFEGESTLQPGEFLHPVIIDLDIESILKSQDSYGIGTYESLAEGTKGQRWPYYVRMERTKLWPSPALFWVDEKGVERQSHSNSQAELMTRLYRRVA